MRSILSVALLVVAVMGCSHPPRPSVTIRAIGPTGDTWYIPHPQPIWRFAITNSGTCAARWDSGVEVRGGSDKDYSHAGGFIDWPEGILGPGEGLLTNMIVPALTGSVWRAEVDYSPAKARDSRDTRTYKDEWR
jgi:hypothetical protein